MALQRAANRFNLRCGLRRCERAGREHVNVAVYAAHRGLELKPATFLLFRRPVEPQDMQHSQMLINAIQH